MPAPIIRVENLSKLYRLGHKEERSRTLVGALTRFASAPLRNFRELRSLTHFDESGAAGDILHALRDVSFEVAPGEVVGLIGRNGAGKSTLLKILSRIMPPTRGRVEIRGRLASLLEVGTGFHPELSGRDNVFLNGAILGMTRREIAKKFDEIVAFAEIEKFIDTPVKRYSSGMYVRLAFAVAAHLEPEILVVDEVLAVGDAAFQKKCLGKMQSVSTSEGRTVLFVSHNMAMIKSLCSKILWLDNGKMIAAGLSSEIIDQYLRISLAPSNLHVDLKDIRRNGNEGTKLKITSVDWLSSLPAFHTDKFSLQINFETYSDVDEISLGIGFSTLEGVRLLSYETDDPGSRFNLKAGSQCSAVLEIENLPISPGVYSINVGARSGPMQGIDYIPIIAQIDVVPGKNTQGHQAKSGAGIRLPSHWKLKLP